MFDEITEKFEQAWRKLRGHDRITESNIQPAIREVRRALLEADVNLQVAKEFVAKVSQRALGTDVVMGVTPEQQFIKVVYDELVALMGSENVPLAQADPPPTVVLMAGLQGTGKTTASAKLALHLRKINRSALLVAADVYRPAAIEQLITLGKQIEVPVFSLGTAVDPVEIAQQGVAQAKEQGIDTVIIDTAGRLQIDEAMMAELIRIRDAVQPTEVLLVVDAMTGQEAANLTRTFHEQVGITGAILTKLDGDTRGGAALSIRYVSGQPIKFIGTGEKVEALEPFHPDRMASRILRMGDVLTLVEKMQEQVNLEDAAKMQEKILSAQFDFEDFLKNTRMIKNMGSFGSILKMIPGMKVNEAQLQEAEQNLKRAEAMIASMTPEERRNPDLIARSPSRKQRIAKGSGYQMQDVTKLVADFQKMRTLMQNMGRNQMLGMAPPRPAAPAPNYGKKKKKRKGFGEL
ncbi:MAG: signal recognition particle protein [Pseudanabaenaceae cyanobacterium SKYGB_i_bin29]|nr:signal recognition particle protein [Pseudanabaenaceae cyanobacterium SKYG29]MDW8422273.1 signal recognition particle protein [Pseudanabaenaceae cyanobacterium SKYGB_i_bin29]